MSTDISRRKFLGGAAIMGASAFAAGLVGCSPDASADAEEGADAAAPVEHNPQNTETCDIVVVGSGTAGMAAAARACQLGASVIQLEKNLICCCIFIMGVLFQKKSKKLHFF